MKVNRKDLRDDSNQSRLYSFLYNKGGLTVSRLSSLKDNVFYLKNENGNEYVLKSNKFSSSIEQQWNFFIEHEFDFSNKFIYFPSGCKVLSGFGSYWTLSPYINGNLLQFNKDRDRHDALITLRKFHKSATGVKIENPQMKSPIYLKGYNRLGKLYQTKHLMEQLGFLRLYEDIVQTTKSRLRKFSEFDWHKIEKKAVDNWTWIHGDVASHNFMRDNDNRVHLIDFDLLSLSPQLYDYIQLGQRFLPHVDWNLSRLLNYFVYQEQQDIEIWLYAITIPADVIREWWHFTIKNRSNEQFIKFLDRLAADWEQRRQFVHEVDTMLR
ncbi:phosphotransferase [Aquibacillus saliphilus]|uniref:phosphotransferase n=1 Tax=Aquibacillus saliphilus TaxID=1909422 RepID=UPI001CF01D13|nr:phosphotransferase [Aquibacillus saliphilus]